MIGRRLAGLKRIGYQRNEVEMRQVLKSVAMLLVGWFVFTLPAHAKPAYHLVATIALGEPDRWDYVVPDSAHHRVYVAHSDRLTVLGKL